LKEDASEHIRKLTYDYYRSGANGEVSLADSEDYFKKIKLKQRSFLNFSKFENTKTKILGYEISSPICIASTAMQKMAHPGGEVAMAKAAAKQNNTTILLSSWATTPLEEVGQAAPDSFKIF